MSSVPPKLVYTGWWNDWSKSNVLGATITTSDAAANVLVAFLAILVATTGTRLWDILVFTCYQLRATENPKDVLFHQQQVLLRNVSTPLSIIIDFVKLSWGWRKKVKGALRRNLFAIAAAAACTIGFTVAGIFSSRVVTSSNISVLVQSNSCGFWNWWQSVEAQDAGLQYLAETQASSLRYSRLCYENGGASRSYCDVYDNREVPFNVTEVDCPFSDSICAESHKPGLRLDTGLLDTSETFGINAKPQDRVQVRKISTCAPLTLDGYTITQDVVDTNRANMTGHKALPGEQETKFFYGSMSGIDSHPTMAMSTYAMNKTGLFGNAFVTSYQNETNTLFSSFVPIQPLRRTDADTTLTLIFGNFVLFYSPVNDVVFSAHKESWAMDGRGGNFTYYISDNPAGVISCLEQYQFCNPNRKDGTGCTEIAGINGAISQGLNLGLNLMQNATLSLFATNVKFWELDMSVSGSTTPPALKLSTQQSSYGGIYSVPDDQWKIEVRGWMSYILASLQRVMADHAIGPENSKWDKYIKPAGDAGERQLCTAQKMLAPSGFSNINVFGFIFTILLCSVIIVVDIFFVNLIKFLSRRKKITMAGLHQWTQDGTLQLQRRIYEVMGEGHWTNLDAEVPTLTDEKVVSDLENALDNSSSSTSALADGPDQEKEGMAATEHAGTNATKQPLPNTAERNASESDVSESSSEPGLRRADTSRSGVSAISATSPTSTTSGNLSRKFSHHSTLHQGSITQLSRVRSEGS